MGLAEWGPLYPWPVLPWLISYLRPPLLPCLTRKCRDLESECPRNQDSCNVQREQSFLRVCPWPLNIPVGSYTEPVFMATSVFILFLRPIRAFSITITPDILDQRILYCWGAVLCIAGW